LDEAELAPIRLLHIQHAFVGLTEDPARKPRCAARRIEGNLLIRIGYACINTKLSSPNRTCRLKNATPEKILELVSANVEALQPILE
jgi:hypothetical protein